MPRWEYLVQNIFTFRDWEKERKRNWSKEEKKRSYEEKAQVWLNELGRQGWELAGTHIESGLIRFFFKRMTHSG